MKTHVIRECGFEESKLGFSLSYNTSLERTAQILPKYAFGIPGESKFLEQILMWVDVVAPRYWWQEADTYRVGTSKQSQSTMHTISKRPLNNYDFEYPLPESTLADLNTNLEYLRNKVLTLPEFKNLIPEGFLQRRIWMFSYKTLQTIYIQRINHKLPQWRYFLNIVLSEIEHPEFIIKDYVKVIE
jgi:hypothetical protein